MAESEENLATDRLIEPEDIDRRVLTELVRLLYHKYPIAKESIINVESYTGEPPLYAVLELRDFIEHMRLAFGQSPEDSYREHHLAQAEEHLRRAIAEPYQAKVLHEIAEIRRLYKTYSRSMIARVIGVDKILSIQMYHDAMREINDLVRRGRLLKARNIWSDEFEDAIQHCFVPAFDRAIKLREELQKVVHSVRWWRGTLLFGVVGSLIASGVAVGLLNFWRWLSAILPS